MNRDIGKGVDGRVSCVCDLLKLPCIFLVIKHYQQQSLNINCCFIPRPISLQRLHLVNRTDNIRSK